MFEQVGSYLIVGCGFVDQWVGEWFYCVGIVCLGVGYLLFYLLFRFEDCYEVIVEIVEFFVCGWEGVFMIMFELEYVVVEEVVVVVEMEQVEQGGWDVDLCGELFDFVWCDVCWCVDLQWDVVVVDWDVGFVCIGGIVVGGDYEYGVVEVWFVFGVFQEVVDCLVGVGYCVGM